MKIADIIKELQKSLSGKKTYGAVVVAGLYWIGAGRGWWPRDPLIDSAAFGAVILALRAGSKTDAKKAVKAIKTDTAKVVKSESAAVVEEVQSQQAPNP